jgi:hypothetical protein
MISNDEEYYAEVAQLKAETEAANKQTEDAKAKSKQLLLDSQLESVYRDAGGISGDAFQALKNSLNCEIDGDKIIIRDSSGNIETNPDGSPKTLVEKMSEAKRHPVYQSFFKPDSTPPQNADSKSQLAPGQFYYTREQARNGKIRMEDINSGKAVLADEEQYNQMDTEGFRQQTKTVNIDDILRGK